jgi:PAS domain S-box-containing protein
MNLHPRRLSRGAHRGQLILLTVEDISARKQAHETLARLAAIIDSSDDAIVGKTLAGVITSWNGAAERIFGYTAAEAIGQHICLIVPADRRAEEDDVIARLRRGEKVDHFQTVRQAKDGRRIDISLTISPIRNTRGDVVGASKIARDISERKRAEREREELLRVAESARAEADSANRAKDEFLAIVSHELRAPMSAMVGWLRILKSAGTRDPDLVRRAVETLERNLKIQVQLINDLLDVSRIRSGKLRLDEQRVAVTTVVAGRVESLRPFAEGKQVALRLNLEEGEPLHHRLGLQQARERLVDAAGQRERARQIPAKPGSGPGSDPAQLRRFLVFGKTRVGGVRASQPTTRR